MIASGNLRVQDISGSLGDERRFYLYEGTNSLFLQVVNSRTGKKMGERIRIASPVFSLDQNAVIDPLGRFIVYATENDVRYQALDVTGNRSGSPKTLVQQVRFLAGLDIIKE
jgi:hypothetical protein